ncbi:arginase family protein [Curtobacterium oceanosedimentum]|uniref:arginase family protein n=1 Tax=Curtobacterium oceanosedimentum TaxID=465820 RepID=UPI001CE0313E|nr:arginase family protein [Curtobacterium oceanosedimentum]MCA5924497.1 arginase family protein [Curtobacterium oceanosedimentum]
MQFLVVGQWQGSASSRAMRLGDGAAAIAADLPRAATTTVEVPTGAGDRLETAVARYTSVLAVAERVAEETAVAPEPVLVVGGDGASVLGATTALTPDTAFVRIAGSSGYRALNRAQPVAAETAALRLLVDRPADLFPGLPVVPAASVVVAGVRGVEEAERAALDRAGVTHLDVDAATPDAVAAAVDATGASAVFVHVDLDVLDPSEVDGLLEPVPFGLDGGALVERIQAATRGRRLAGAALTGFAPVDPSRAVDDLGVILRVVGAVTTASRTA